MNSIYLMILLRLIGNPFILLILEIEEYRRPLRKILLTEEKFIELLNDAISILGKKWTTEILWHLAQNPLQFSELETLCSGISAKMLTQRLKDLQEYGLVTKVILSTNPMKVSYALSDNAKTLNLMFYELSVFSLYKMGSGLSRVRAFALAKIRKDLRTFYLGE